MTELLLAYSWTKMMKLPTSSGEWGWFCLGLMGNAVFFTRFLFQWLHSEKHKESRIPTTFWWQSIAGTFLMLAYFTHRGDIPGMLGYVANVVPYTRNLMLVYRKRRLDREAAEAAGMTVDAHVAPALRTNSQAA